MIKKLFLLSCFLYITTMLYPQDILLERNITMQKLFIEKRESFLVHNEEDGTLALFLLDQKTMQAQLLDRNFNAISSLAALRPKSEFTDLLGYNLNDGTYNLFFTNIKRKSFFCKTMNMAKGVSSEQLLPIHLKKEKFLECVSYKNHFYIITVTKSSDILKIYVFENGKDYEVKQLDLSGFKFSDSRTATLDDILIKGINMDKFSNDFRKVDINNPNSLEITSKANKLYCFDNKLFFTFDNESRETKILTIRLDNFSFEFKTYQNGIIECGDEVVIGSNSYLYNNLLFQIRECSMELYFSVYDIEKDLRLKELGVKKDQEITFKNTPLFQEGSLTMFKQNSKQEIENTKVLLRKIAYGYPAVSAYSSSGNYIVTLGGYAEIKHTGGGGGGGMMMTSPGGVTMGSSGNVVVSNPTYSFNPAMGSYQSYTNSRSTYFRSVFDSISFDHITGEVDENGFDKIKSFSEPIEKHIFSETIIKLKDYYVYGYYNDLENKYYLRKFSN